MERLLIAGVFIGIAVVVATILQRRKPAPPSAPQWNVPVQLDRQDFHRPDAQWFVAVFTSATCDTCAGVAAKATPLDAGHGGPVCVQVIEVGAEPELHRRYGIDAVPLVLVADQSGVVVRHFIGPVTATDLWAAVAQEREPGSSPDHRSTHEHD